MRIFIASGIFHPEPGGPATYLHHLLPALQARGHDVTALAFGDAPSDDYPYPLTRISRGQPYPQRLWAYRRAAAELWPGHDVAYVHSLGLPLPAEIRPRVGKIVGDKAWERAVNRGWVLPDTDVDAFQQEWQPTPAALGKMLRARQARSFDRVIVPSAYLKRMVAGWGVDPARIAVIVNAVQPVAPLTANQAEARRQLDLPDGPLLLTVARLTPWKGIDHTLRALTALPDVHLLVAGDGPARAELESLAHDLRVHKRVTFRGQAPRERMPLMYRAADYTLLYSGYEGLPHVLLESLQMGTPAIASDKGGNPEVVRDGVNGLLAPYPDPDALAEVLAGAFAPGERDRLAAHSAEGLDRFDPGRMVEQTLAVLESAAGGRDVHPGG